MKRRRPFTEGFLTVGVLHVLFLAGTVFGHPVSGDRASGNKGRLEVRLQGQAAVEARVRIQELLSFKEAEKEGAVGGAPVVFDTAPGRYLVRVEAEGGAVALAGPVDVRVGGRGARLAVELEQGYTVQGKVMDVTGTPLAGVQVHYCWTDSRFPVPVYNLTRPGGAAGAAGATRTAASQKRRPAARIIPPLCRVPFTPCVWDGPPTSPLIAKDATQNS